MRWLKVEGLPIQIYQDNPASFNDSFGIIILHRVAYEKFKPDGVVSFDVDDRLYDRQIQAGPDNYLLKIYATRLCIDLLKGRMLTYGKKTKDDGSEFIVLQRM